MSKKDFTTGISEKMYLDQLEVKETMIKVLQSENARLKCWLEFIATMQWGELKDCKNYAKQALNGSEVRK